MIYANKKAPLNEPKIAHNEEMYKIMIDNTQMRISRKLDKDILTYLAINNMALTSYK